MGREQLALSNGESAFYFVLKKTQLGVDGQKNNTQGKGKKRQDDTRREQAIEYSGKVEMPESLFNRLELRKCTQSAHQPMGEHVRMTRNFC